MSNAASNYLEAKILDHVLGNTAFAQPTGLQVALFDNTSGNAATNLEAGTITDEISGSGYTRENVSFNAVTVVDAGASNSADIEFGPAGVGGWGTVTHIAVVDGSSNVLFWGALSASKTISENDSLRIAAGNLTITLT